MPGNYFKTLFGHVARHLQQQVGSREAYARKEAAAEGPVDPLSERELLFIAARDSFYMATVTDTGWPYVQHRGGPVGFVKPLGQNRIGFADYGGNRQFITAANLKDNDRVSLFFMDYAARRRLKLIGHATIADPKDFPLLVDASTRELVERAVLIDIVGFDWNCRQHIAERFTHEEIREMNLNENQLREETK